MNAVSPYLHADVQRQDQPNAVSGLASGVAKGLNGAADVANAFAEIWSDLDINADAKLNAADLAGHAIAAGKDALGTLFGGAIFGSASTGTARATGGTAESGIGGNIGGNIGGGAANSSASSAALARAIDARDMAQAAVDRTAVERTGPGLGALSHRLYTASGAALDDSAVTPRASELAAKALSGAYSEMRALQSGPHPAQRLP